MPHDADVRIAAGERLRAACARCCGRATIAVALVIASVWPGGEGACLRARVLELRAQAGGRVRALALPRRVRARGLRGARGGARVGLRAPRGRLGGCLLAAQPLQAAGARLGRGRLPARHLQRARGARRRRLGLLGGRQRRRLRRAERLSSARLRVAKTPAVRDWQARAHRSRFGPARACACRTRLGAREPRAPA